MTEQQKTSMKLCQDNESTKLIDTTRDLMQFIFTSDHMLSVYGYLFGFAQIIHHINTKGKISWINHCQHLSVVILMGFCMDLERHL